MPWSMGCYRLESGFLLYLETSSTIQTMLAFTEYVSPHHSYNSSYCFATRLVD
jgi:hypothetical protein